MRARFRLYSPDLFDAFRTVPFGPGDVHMIYARHRHTGQWMPQALTFAYPSKKFPDMDTIYEWVVNHGFKQKMPNRRKPVIEWQGQKKAFAGLGDENYYDVFELAEERVVEATQWFGKAKADIAKPTARTFANIDRAYDSLGTAIGFYLQVQDQVSREDKAYITDRVNVLLAFGADIQDYHRLISRKLKKLDGLDAYMSNEQRADKEWARRKIEEALRAEEYGDVYGVISAYRAAVGYYIRAGMQEEADIARHSERLFKKKIGM